MRKQYIQTVNLMQQKFFKIIQKILNPQFYKNLNKSQIIWSYRKKHCLNQIKNLPIIVFQKKLIKLTFRINICFRLRKKNLQYKLKNLITTFSKKTHQNVEFLKDLLNDEQAQIMIHNIISQNEEVNPDTQEESNQSLISENKFLYTPSNSQSLITKNSNEQSENLASNISSRVIAKEESNEKSETINYKLISSTQQKEICTGIAINRDGSLIAASCNNDIKIWKFKDGILIDQKILLKGHESVVFCIIFSKKIDWFLSGGMDNSIRCWIDRNKKSWFSSHSWEGSKAYTQHSNSILCLLLNEKEDELLSSSSDHSIKIWSVKSGDNLIEYKYSLNKHKNQVFQISLNSTDTEMVSCSEDRSIIIWSKNENNKWEFKYIINQDVDEYGLRINFCSDDTIIWCQNSKPIAQVFKFENGIFQHKPELSIKLKPFVDSEFGSDYCFFPSKYNSSTQTLILNQNKYIYRIKKSKNDSFYIDGDVIVNNAASCYGTIQDDQKYIVIWNKESSQMQVYKACYE
ncbi:unnamed protein product (macronuclear) [Paramecium tetraurelia]|uniref:Uncharacterized protein n=1 Tax=Paramecium tetraurelia TaxID=5888 RepID=A0DP19_PARTE|nr:uncharacterized protein GSPATT00018982001 [Paramecium tetraurelia]CAK84786.1 unnamed protein product [Paramecium tetraurelia]|eukprot:XP_001452183.1 hypothetical protein (macronuclear) [Paramecium tetraurelia strain d4-2]